MSQRSIILGCILVPVLLLAGSCSDDATDPNGGGVSPTGDYLKALPAWDEFSPPLDDGVVDTGDCTECLDVVQEQRYLCVETPKSITDTPEDVVTFNAGGDILWPGALIQGATYVGGLGTMEELGIRQRAPLTISVNFLNGNSRRVVQNPDLATVQEAVGELIQAASDAALQTSSSIFFTQTEAYSMDQLALGLNLRASYMGATVRSNLEIASTAERHTLAAYFKQAMFTVTIVQPQTPEAIFSADFTQERLQEQIELGRIGPDNLPVYVSQIVYGRMLIMTMTSSRSVSEMRAALQASYAAARAGVDLEDLSVIEDSEIKVVAVGGQASAAQGLLETGQLATYFGELADLTSAAPIAYTLRNLSDNKVAAVSETTSYTERVCSAVAINYFDLESSWRNSVLGAAGDAVHTFVPNAATLALAQELDHAPSANDGLRTELTFLGADTGFPFDFKLTTPQSWPFVYNDQESGNAYDGCSYPHLAPGDADNGENDDFSVIVTRVDDGLAISGIAVNVGNNGTGPEEYLEVYSPGDVMLEQFTDNLPASTGYTFMGVASPLPLGHIFFNEDAGGDDICFQNVWFSVRSDDAGGSR